MKNIEQLLAMVESGDSEAQKALAHEIARENDISLKDSRTLLDNAQVRRWVRGVLLDVLEPDRAAELAEYLLQWPDDFEPTRRDSTTANVVARLPEPGLEQSLSFLAGSNAANALWERVAESESLVALDVARAIFQWGDARARETTLHLLILDPYGPQYLVREEQNLLLAELLDDSDPEIRGLAAEVVAADLPEALFQREETAPLDESERVRMAYWRAALTYRPDSTIEAAGLLACDASQALPARRTALLALGELVSTSTVSPVLQMLLQGDNEVLAVDAAQLMWRYHRTPDIATAASKSEFEPVRNLAERLLHPERGSPAAGGSRPGDQTRMVNLIDQIGSQVNRDDPENEP